MRSRPFVFTPNCATTASGARSRYGSAHSCAAVRTCGLQAAFWRQGGHVLHDRCQPGLALDRSAQFLELLRAENCYESDVAGSMFGGESPVREGFRRRDVRSRDGGRSWRSSRVQVPRRGPAVFGCQPACASRAPRVAQPGRRATRDSKTARKRRRIRPRAGCYYWRAGLPRCYRRAAAGPPARRGSPAFRRGADRAPRLPRTGG